MYIPASKILPRQIETYWHCGDKTIQRSQVHDEMYIVNHPDGTFHTVRSSHDLMKTKYPPNGK